MEHNLFYLKKKEFDPFYRDTVYNFNCFLKIEFLFNFSKLRFIILVLGRGKFSYLFYFSFIIFIVFNVLYVSKRNRSDKMDWYILYRSSGGAYLLHYK